MSALSKIRAVGFFVELLEGESLSIVPASKITPEQREFIKSHKLEIIDELTQSANDPAGLESIENWLTWINEDDPEIIDEVLDKCRADPEALKYFQMRAKEVPPYFNSEPEPEKHVCQECQHWTRDKIGDGTGLGLCELDQNPLPWPNQDTCTKFVELIVDS